MYPGCKATAPVTAINNSCIFCSAAIRSHYLTLLTVIRSFNTGMSTIHQAIIRRNQQQVRLLANVGCNVNKLDSRMRTPLRLVCDLSNEFLRVSLGRVLLRHGAGVKHRDEFGISVFSYCCIKQCTKLVAAMIEEREIPWLDKDNEGNTALHHTAASGNHVITRMVIGQMRKYGLDIDQRNDFGETPLILAERMGHLQCAELLRDRGKASTAARDDLLFKNADEWRQTWTTRAPRKLSPYFRLVSHSSPLYHYPKFNLNERRDLIGSQRCVACIWYSVTE